MKSPLKIDKETVKENNITEDIELSPVAKISFLEDQLDQIKKMHWRARVDMLHALRLQEDSNPVLREKGFSNMATHRNEMQQSIGAIRMLQTLIKELREEYPELQVEE
jgi:uncharacterized 2Fe-2S/4Fe-4S cluster protein (DUF4445 family)